MLGIFQEEVSSPSRRSRRSRAEQKPSRWPTTPFGLAAAIHTRNISRAHHVAAALQCGIVSIDDHHRLDPASPCGGVKLSGVGREFGPESFNDHFEVKSVMVNMSDQPFDWYGETAQQGLN
jgi:hypothetical protein